MSFGLRILYVLAVQYFTYQKPFFLNCSMQCSAGNHSTRGFMQLRKGIYVEFRST
jgi:hypothetical protein